MYSEDVMWGGKQVEADKGTLPKLFLVSGRKNRAHTKGVMQPHLEGILEGSLKEVPS